MKYLLLFVLIFQLSSVFCQDSITQQSLVVASNENPIFIIRNLESESISFLLSINNSYPVTKERVIQKVKDLADKHAIPVERAAWLYVASYTHFSSPINHDNWFHDPEILLNTSSSGWCDDAASVLTIIWEWLGYEARVWGLSGHVVAEVRIDSLWQMYDADRRVYYLNDSNKIASVEDLETNTHLILNTQVSPYSIRMNKCSWYDINSKLLAKVYASAEDNQISDWSKDYNQIQHNFEFVLPQNAKLVFPIIGLEQNSRSLFPNVYLKATIYQNDTIDKSTAQIKIPSIISHITGSANFKQKDTIVAAKDLITNHPPSFNENFELSDIEDSVQLFYYFNYQHFLHSRDSFHLTLDLDRAHLLEVDYCKDDLFYKYIPYYETNSCFERMICFFKDKEYELSDSFLINMFEKFCQEYSSCYEVNTTDYYGKMNLFLDEAKKKIGQPFLSHQEILSTLKDQNMLNDFFVTVFKREINEIIAKLQIFIAEQEEP